MVRLVYVIDVSKAAGLRLLARRMTLTSRGNLRTRPPGLYERALYGPDGGTTRTVPAAGIVHMFDIPSIRRARGVAWDIRAQHEPPWIADNLLSSHSDAPREEESGAPVAHVIPSPVDGAADSTATLREDIKAARGGVLLAETQMGGYGDKAGAPASDFAVKRIGANPPDVLRALASETGERIMEACAVPGALLVASADGTSQREALRRWVHCHVAPLGRIVAAELSDKLDLPGLTMGFEALYGSDVVGRASAFKRLVEAGMAIEKAVALAGLVASDE